MAADEKQIDTLLEELVLNVTSSRQELINRFFDSKRDVNKECYYPNRPTESDYDALYNESGVAARVVEVIPEESWKLSPEVYELESTDSVTKFEEAWDALGTSLYVEESHYKQEEGNRVWEYLKRLDVISGIGSYGLLLFGIDDGLTLDQPAKFGRESAKLNYLRVFSHSQAQVTKMDADPASPRFGAPEFYLITVNDPRETTTAAIGVTTASLNVHWTRVLHFADNLKTSEWFARPRMSPVFKHLLDIVKIMSAAPEGYWKTCFSGLAIETNPQLGGQVQVDKVGLRKMMEDYQNGMQRYLALMGMTAKTLAPQVIDPTPFVNVLLDLICIRLGIPIRIFKGSERGELASNQDANTFEGRIRHRRQFVVTPKIIVPFVDRLINLGVLPKPAKGYSIKWPPSTQETAQMKADLAFKQVDTIVKYVGGNAMSVVSPQDLLTRFMGFNEEEAESMLEASAEVVEEAKVTEQEDAAAQAEANQKMGLNPDGTAIKQEPTKAEKPTPATGNKPANVQKSNAA